jgi:4-hydroxybenzoate polyprenyltransferase
MYSLRTVNRTRSLWPYIQIARIDHWFKNTFMLLGVLLALFYEPTLFTWASVLRLSFAVMATCFVASSNYVLNELLDAPQDRFHPVKKHRPVPSELIQPTFAVLEWLLLGATGLTMAFFLNPYFAASGLALWCMGIAYNVPPVRTKELPYLDVLSEAVNNPLRLFLGWFALVADKVPPLSLTLAYWMAGAFFMATKRFAEYRCIGDPEAAAQYRRSFGYYTEDRLLISMFFYAIMCALFVGVFIVRYHVELIIFVPMAAGFFAYYLKLGLQDNSPVQNPEKLYKNRGFLLYMTLSVVLFILLMFIHIPRLHNLFKLEPSPIEPLWKLGSLSNASSKSVSKLYWLGTNGTISSSLADI